VQLKKSVSFWPSAQKAWEYPLYAGVLWQRRQALELKWRDHELGYARRTRHYLDDMEALRFLHNASYDLAACVQNLPKMLDAHAREQAFGPPGQPGNPALIEHLATRFVEIYEEMLDVAATLRGTGVSENIATVMEAAARLTDTPLREIRDLIDQVVAETDRIPDRVANGEQIRITLTLNLTMDDGAKKHFEREMRRADKGSNSINKASPWMNLLQTIS